VFCIGSGRFIGFVVSRDGIRLDSLKVQGILDFPPPSNILQLQRLQGKSNLLRRFIPNYDEMTKGFTSLLKKGIPFHLDKVAQASFDSLKGALIRTSLMYSLNYQNNYYLYLATIDTTIGMVLVQEQDGIE